MRCVCQVVCACMHARVCVCVCVCSALCSLFRLPSRQSSSVSQGTAPQARGSGRGQPFTPSPLPAGAGEIPFPSAPPLWALCKTACPVGAGQQHHHLLPLWPPPFSRSWDRSCSPALVPCPTGAMQGCPAGREGKGSRRGSDASSPQALPQRLSLLSFHPSLLPACASIPSGNFRWFCLCRGWSHPSPGPWCSPARVAVAAAGETLTTLQAAKEDLLGSGAWLPAAALLENSTCPRARRETLSYSDLEKS